MHVTIPKRDRFALCTATLPLAVTHGLDIASSSTQEGLVSADIIISQGVIEAVLPAGTAPMDLERLDLAQRMVLPCFADLHTHIDKGHIWDRQPNPTGDFDGALAAVEADRQANWNAEDLMARMEFSLKCAYAHGTKALRTHMDSMPPQHHITFDVFSKLRDQWQGHIELQGVALFTIDAIDDQGYLSELADIVAQHGCILGCVTFPVPDIDARLDLLFQAAAARQLDLDLHVDETLDPDSLTLLNIAEAKLRHNFTGAVTVGHCCSLSRQSEERAAHTIAKVKQANISVVSLPMCNMYLQDRHAGRTPRVRGVTLVQELRAAGIPVAVASDNTRDPFYAYGDLDMVEVLREAVRMAHLDHPLDAAASLITSQPATIMNLTNMGKIAATYPADLVIFNARRWSEFLSRPQADRIVLRNGTAIDRHVPDYSDLDMLMGAQK